VTSTLASVVLLATTGSARAADPDPWFARDKALHFSACAVVSAGGYGAAALATDDVRIRLAVGAGSGIAIGAAKEIWDLTGRGDPSMRDLTWDLVGTLTGVAVASLIDWMVHRSSTGRVARAP
jgi:putative lipoprotein